MRHDDDRLDAMAWGLSELDTAQLRAAFARAWDPLVNAFATLAVSVGEVIEAVTGVVLAYLNDPQLVARRAIEQYGVTEADIRRVEGQRVVLWNRRVIDTSVPVPGRVL